MYIPGGLMMFDKKDKKKLTEKVKFTESKKYKSMNKDEIIRKVIEKEEMLKKLKDELSETKKVVQEKDNLSQEYLKHLERLQDANMEKGNFFESTVTNYTQSSSMKGGWDF